MYKYLMSLFFSKFNKIYSVWVEYKIVSKMHNKRRIFFILTSNPLMYQKIASITLFPFFRCIIYVSFFSYKCNFICMFFMSANDKFLSVPLVSRVLPSDICKIHKSGASIRMDTTLVDFNDMRWERGDISFIFNGDQKPGHSLTVLDNKAKLFQRVRHKVKILTCTVG